MVHEMKTKQKARTRAADEQTRGARKGQTVIRPFVPTDSEYADIVAIENANYPDEPLAVSEFKFYDETSGDEYLHERLVAERDERVVGFVTYGQPWWSFQEGKFFLWLSVDPDWHDSAVGKELYTAMLAALQPHGPRQLTCEVREDQRYVIDLLGRQGFAITQRNPKSALDLRSFDETRFAEAIERVNAAGIRIDGVHTLAADDADWQRKVYDLEWEILQDVPSPDPLTRAPFEEWRERTFDSPNFVAEGYLVARHGDRYVGMSSLWKSMADETRMGTGLTGVIRPYRRGGIATALKVQGLCFARAYGVQSVETDNEANNPMLDLNKQLGFQEKPAYIMYAKELAEAVPAREKKTKKR